MRLQRLQMPEPTAVSLPAAGASLHEQFLNYWNLDPDSLLGQVPSTAWAWSQYVLNFLVYLLSSRFMEDLIQTRDTKWGIQPMSRQVSSWQRS